MPSLQEDGGGAVNDLTHKEKLSFLEMVENGNAAKELMKKVNLLILHQMNLGFIFKLSLRFAADNFPNLLQ